MPKGLLKICWGEKKNLNLKFVLLLMVIKNCAVGLKVEVKQIKPQGRPFQNCLLFPRIASFIHKDDFRSIVKLVAYARRSLADCAMQCCTIGMLVA